MLECVGHDPRVDWGRERGRGRGSCGVVTGRGDRARQGQVPVSVGFCPRVSASPTYVHPVREW